MAAISKSKLNAERDKVRNIETQFKVKILHPGIYDINDYHRYNKIFS